MHLILRLILAILAGLVVGSLVNGSLIMLSPKLIAPPSGVNVNDLESIKANMHLYQPKHFIMPFLAHALGTLMGAFVAAKIAKEKGFSAAMIVGASFFLGGLMMVLQLPAPMWFNVLDLGVAYVPMAWLGAMFANKK